MAEDRAAQAEPNAPTPLAGEARGVRQRYAAARSALEAAAPRHAHGHGRVERAAPPERTTPRPSDAPSARERADARGGASTVRRILLGSVLRRLREAAGLSMREAGYPIRATASKISRLETGKVSFKQRDIEDLLTLYGILDDTERARVLDLVREANTLGWWHGFGQVLPPWFEAFVGLESAAAVVRTYEIQFIPGLLQCPAYTRAVVSANRTLTASELQRRIELRTRRQAILERDGGPQLWVVLNEAALRRPIGGPTVMRTQIRHLIDQATRPNVTVRLLPYAAGAHAAEGGAFTLLRFAEADLPDVVYLEHLTGARYIEKAEDIEHYTRAMGRISIDALHPDATVAALEYLIR